MTLLEVESLIKRYGSIVAVDDLSFSVTPGETVGLLGPNGAGKTTTMGCIVGLLQPDGGQIAVDGLAPNAPPMSAMVGYAAQRTALYLSLRVSDNLSYFGGLYGLRGGSLTKAAEKIVDLFDLGSLTERRVKDLSLGQQKLVHLATAVIHEPRLLLVDEPTAGLDVSARRRVIDGIRRLAAQGTAVIFSTHYLEEADEACDSLVIIDHGQRVAAGPLADLLAAVADPATVITLGNGETVSFDDRDLLAAINSVDQDQIAEVVVEMPGGAAQLVITALACAATYVALAIALTSLCRTMSQLNAASTLGPMAAAGAGGAIAQITTLPGWVQAIAPASPVYWAIDAYRSVLAGEQGFGRAIAMLLGFAALFIAVTLWQFRADKPKESFGGE